METLASTHNTQTVGFTLLFNPTLEAMEQHLTTNMNLI